MLCLLVLVLYSTIINTQSSKVQDAESATLGCILPSPPKNGRYEILEPEIPNLSPGAKLSNYTLQLACDPGYHLTESVISICFGGGVTPLPMSECLPHCNYRSLVTSRILTCGLESRCLMPDDLYDYNDRIGQIEEQLNCGSTGPVMLPIVSGGKIAERKEVPWHAGIYLKTKQPYMQICGGSLISPNVVISAAHCFWNDVEKKLPASNYAVAVGKIYRPWNNKHDEHAQKSDVAEIKIPPRYQGSATNLQDDIAVVIVTSPFSFNNIVTPVCLDFDFDLDQKHLAPGVLGKVAGWGLTGDNDPASPVLKTVELPIIKIDDCIDKSDPSFTAHITSDKICAGYQNGTSVCKGDSGGGLAFPEAIRGVRRYFLRGVVSAAPRNENLCNTFAWGSFTHVQKHEPFIRDTVPGKPSSPATIAAASSLL